MILKILMNIMNLILKKNLWFLNMILMKKKRKKKKKIIIMKNKNGKFIF
jgi:hypothetical protein